MFVAGFLLVLILAAFLSNTRFAPSDATQEVSVLSSLAMLIVFTLIGSVLGLEIFAVDLYEGAKSEPSADRWYIPSFLMKILLISTLFVLGFSNILPSIFNSYSLLAV